MNNYNDESAYNDYLRSIKHVHIMNEQEEREAFRNNDVDAILESQLKFVVGEAKKYIGLGIDLLDLIQEGNCGVMEAIERFDLDKGVRFNTYAAYWIRRYILGALTNKSRSVRIPAHIASDITTVSRAKRTLEESLGENVRPEHIAKYLDMELDRVNDALIYGCDVLSLNNVNNEGDEYINILKDEKTDVCKEVVMNDSLKRLNEALKLDILNEKEKDIVFKIYGIGCDRMQYDEIGKIYGVSKQRIDQLNKRALEKLRKYLR